MAKASAALPPESTLSQTAQDREAARKMLREIVDGEDMYPVQQRIAAAKTLMETDEADAANQELLAMELTEAQLVDIVARAQAAEALAAASSGSSLGETANLRVEPAVRPTPPVAAPAPPALPKIPFSQRLDALLGDMDDPLCQ